MTTEAIELQREAGYQLIASDQPQLEAAHQKMIEWARGQIARCTAEAAEESESLAVAEAKHWSTAGFKRRIALLQKRVVFYEKIEIALQAGYVIVPNFAMNVFAIRTALASPRGGVEPEMRYHNQFVQTAQELPAGGGEYRNPVPEVVTEHRQEPDGNGGTKMVGLEWPADEFSDIAFPLALAKPALMTRTAEAMAVKVFDEIGVAVDAGSAAGDPILLGRLRNPRKNRPALTFFIGWYFDPSRL